jgi:hypothetical protein
MPPPPDNQALWTRPRTTEPREHEERGPWPGSAAARDKAGTATQAPHDEILT